MNNEVLILTGSFLLDKQSTVKSLLLKQISQFRNAEHLWLEIKIKLIFAENLILGNLEKKRWVKKNINPRLSNFFSFRLNSDTPDLAEVTLATLLNKENIKYRLRSYDDLFANQALIEKDLAECSTVFVSATYLKDLSELNPILEKVKRSHNKVVVGGALTGALHHNYQGSPSIDVLAIGTGEYLVPAMAGWIRGDLSEPEVPVFGKKEMRGSTLFLFSGADKELSLDNLESPNWRLSEIDHNKKYRMVFYESVRGCPYRCAFCNYPFLFDDNKFRTKSAQKMISDWREYQNIGVEYVTCLDSLFTMPKSRLVEFAEGLIRENIKLKWICYARTDDLCDEEVVKLLVKSGCIQVQIGIESGNAQVLNNMNKRTDPETNEKALLNCKKHNLTTLITLISGFPGETKETIDETINFFKRAPADFFFICVFSARVSNVPILSAQNRKKFDIQLLDNDFSLSPYWSHSTMNCQEATVHARRMTQELINQKLCVDASMFYSEILDFHHADREALLELQKEALKNGKFISMMFTGIFKVLDFFLRRDLNKSLPRSLSQNYSQKGATGPL
ncbi:MAG: radical SAM protein [Bdellovibrionales bacterium]|nr:radical SAM protein [Bdellovibrionales bacterium]